MMAVNMTPTTERVAQKSATHSRRSIPLFNSPKIRKSMGQLPNGSPVVLLDTSLDKAISAAGVEFDPSKTASLVVCICYVYEQLSPLMKIINFRTMMNKSYGNDRGKGQLNCNNKIWPLLQPLLIVESLWVLQLE